MNPLQLLLMAARGHAGLPPTIARPAAKPAAPSGASDQTVASHTAAALTQAVAAVKDPQLKVALSTALASLHKYLANDEKEMHAAMGGKFSPRLMARASGK